VGRLIREMAKCEICGSRILKKIIGSVVKDPKGKKHTVCNECQRKFPAKEEILKNLR